MSFRLCLLLVMTCAMRGDVFAASAEAHQTLRFYAKGGKPQSGESLGFSPSGQEVVFVTELGTTFIRVSDGEQIGTARVTGNKLGYSSDGRSLVLLSPGIISRLDCGTRQVTPMRVPAPPPGSLGIRVAQKNGKTVVEGISSGSPAERDGRLAIGDEIVAIGRDRRNEPKSVLGLSLKDINTALSGAPATAVELFVQRRGDGEATTVRLVRALTRQRDGTTEYYAAELQTADPSLICLVRDGRCELVRPSNGRIVTFVPTQHLPMVRNAALSPDGRHVALIGQLSNGRLGVECVDAIDNKTTSMYDLPDENSHDAHFTADGKAILTLSSTRIVKLDLENQSKPVLFNHEGTLDSQTFPGAYVVAGNQLDQVFNFNAFGGGFRWRLVRSNPLDPQPLHTLIDRVRTLHRLAISRNGILAIGTDEGDVHLLDVTTGSTLQRFGKKGDGTVQLLDFSPDGGTLAYYVAGTLHIVDVSGIRDTAIASGKLDRVDATPESSQFTVTSTEGAFTATFPGKPEYDPNQKKYEAQLDNGRVKYAVVCMNFGPKLAERTKNPAALRDLYDTVGSSFAKHTNGHIESTVDHDTKPVVERSIRWRFQQGGKEMHTSARLTACEGRMYILSVTQDSPGSVTQDEIDRFFGTFAARKMTRQTSAR